MVWHGTTTAASSCRSSLHGITRYYQPKESAAKPQLTLLYAAVQLFRGLCTYLADILLASLTETQAGSIYTLVQAAYRTRSS